jgi:hypothetical protein
MCPDKTKKGAALFGGRPFLKIGMFIPRRSGHLARILIDAAADIDALTELEYVFHAIRE